MTDTALRQTAVSLMWLAAFAVLPSLVAASQGTASEETTDQPDQAPPAEQIPPNDPRITALHATTASILSLLDGSLDPAVPPQSLFDVPLNDEEAIAVEAQRLTAIVRELSPAQDTSTQDDSDSHAPLRDTEDTEVVAVAQPSEAPVERELLAARLRLDEARLAFYSLSKAQRDEVLTAHEQKRTAADMARQAGSQAKARAQQAEIDQKLALEAALQARTEAARLVAEEEARLLGIAKQQADLDSALSERRAALEQRAEVVLALRRKAKEILSLAGPKAPAAADALYTELRHFLRATRVELSDALFEVMTRPRVPEPGARRLANLPEEIDRSHADALRQKAADAAEELNRTWRELRWERAQQLYQETRGLNDDRLALLSRLSAPKRAALTGFHAAGSDQAFAEVIQVVLVMRYHVLATLHWFAETIRGQGLSKWSYLTILAVLGKWLLLLAVFFWWRRRANKTMEAWRAKALDDARRRRAVSAGWIDKVARFTLRVRSPLEWLCLVLGLHAALPDGAEAQLEVQLLLVVLLWTIGGAVAVAVLDALARQDAVNQSVASDTTAMLRLRSLRVVSRTVVAFGLILGLADRLVGKGTIHEWVLSTCWLASVPVGLLLVAWWRSRVFARIEARRKKNDFEKWIVARQSGGASFIAALVGGVYLVVRGVLRFLRNWISRFDITRRALAYLFRRGLDKLAEERPRAALRPLPDALFHALSPEVGGERHISSRAEANIERIVSRIRETGGGVFAIVGERGLGKTTAMNTVARAMSSVEVVSCPIGGIEDLTIELAKIAGLPPAASLRESAALFDSRGRDSGLIIDDAHRLIRPVMGGLDGFDRLIDVIRHHSSHCMWVLALDEVVWRFFERARGAKPVFDGVVWLEPWREEEIAELLTERTQAAGIEPDFTELLVGAEAHGDELERHESLERVRSGYYRLLWDYASGNPGVALHMWRKSLGISETDRIFVKFFQTPDVRELEELPDSAAFVLRAAIQLEAALPRDIAKTAMLSEAAVENALRYGLVRGYFTESNGRHTVTWAWYRAVTDYLRRRHLLAAGR